jgi:hypothetical protein
MTKRTQVSTSTKRMQSDLNRVFVALAVCPLVTNVVPTALHIFGISSCQNYPFLTLGCSLAFVSAPVLNPLTAMFFVRPYRRIVLYWLGLNRQPPQLQLAGGAIRHLPMLTTASGALPSIPRQLPYLQRAASTVDSTELNQNLNE